ncbi:MAG: hypothetical protein ACO3I0_02090 [Limisphaerales bacterium]
MAFDGTDFVDADVSPTRTPSAGNRAPTREELDAQLTGTQQQLAKLKEAQDQLERARAAVEEMRRRRSEFANGRGEMLQSLTRGIGILEQSEHEARQNAEQMAKSLVGLREALGAVEQLNEQAWTAETWEKELTRALTTIENARREYQGACRSWPVLDGKSTGETAGPGRKPDPIQGLASLPMMSLCRLGLALTWPVAVAALVGVIVLIVISVRR